LKGELVLKMSEDSGAELYKKGNESFVSEDYDRAIELYTSALSQDPTLLECYAAKAQALIRSEKYDVAKREADRGVDILRGIVNQDPNGKATGELKKCMQRSGVASFHLGKFKEAKNTFQETKKLDETDKGVNQWITWCDEKIARFGDNVNKSEPNKTTNKASTDEKVENSVSDTQAKAAQAQPAADPAPPTNEMPVPKIKHDWYQTETHVIIEVRIKKLDPKEVKVDFHPTSLSVTAKLAVGSDYSLELDLAHPVVPEQSSYKVLSTKLEVRLRKVEGVRWAALEGDGAPPLPGGGASTQTSSSVRAPYASGRDWNKIEKTLAAEAEEKKEGEQALNEMFQKIYADASDDVKKAMNKSFSESGGTVLSTNWNDIGKEKTDVKPPDGMEFKKWD